MRKYACPTKFNLGYSSVSAMEELDGDTVRLSSRGRYAERDIVQVCHFTFHTCHISHYFMLVFQQNITKMQQ